MSRPCRGNTPHLIGLLTGTLSASEADRIRQHLASCPRCGTAYSRLEKTASLCRELGSEPAPDLPWRKIEAQIQWRLSRPDPTEKTAAIPARRRSWLALASATAFGVLAAVAIMSSFARPAPSPVAGVVLQAPPQPAPRGAELAALVTLAQGEVKVLAPGGNPTPLVLTRPLLQGDRLLTSSGARVGLQWAEGSGALLLGDSEAELRRLRTGEQELVLHEGRLAAQLAPLPPRARFSIVASGIRASVRGTQFAVALHREQVEVEVFEGVVEVAPLDGRWRPVRVAAGLSLRTSGRTGERPTPVAASGSPPFALNLQRWPGLFQTMVGSGLVSVESRPEGAEIRFDSRQVGTTNLTLRGSVGRHLVELWKDGQLLRRQWVEVDLSPGRLALDMEQVPPSQRLPASVYEVFRRRAVQIQRCYERALKAEPTLRGRLTLRVTIGKSGKVDAARLETDTLADPRVGQCALATVRGWEFPAGAAPVELVYPLHLRPR
jgi:ferric-dicitrate binding protein FerR (iron transport regulator)